MIYTFFIIALSTLVTSPVFADQEKLQRDILPTWSESQNIWVLSWVSDTTNVLDAVLAYVRDSIFGLMWMIAIGVFLYIWFKLVVARWNPEEFKKALNTLIYAVIGIFVVSFAFAAVRLVAGLNI